MNVTSALEILETVDRGIPNSERVPIRVNASIELGTQWLGIGIRREGRRIFPLNDSLIWLGNGVVNPGDWLVVYSGHGTPTTTNVPDREGSIYTIHWNRSQTIFNTDAIQPYLMDAQIYLPPSQYENLLPEY